VNEKLAWYVTRSSGWVAFVLLAVTVVWGVLGITKVIERKGLPRWMMDLHRYVALLTIVFTGVHLAGLVADNFVHIGWREILVPYALDWKPGAVTLGIVAFYLLIAVQVSSWMKSRLPRSVWKSIHMLSYPAMWLVAMHGLKAGTDASNRAVRVGVALIVVVTSFLTLLRIVMGRTARRNWASALAPVAPVAVPAQGAPAPGAAQVMIPPQVATSVSRLDQMHAVTESLHQALDKVHAAWPAPLPTPGPQPHVERRQEARTLVSDVPPPS
jgi:DMSO/TMAO reductase YedYZ heme-binding membrane subunit